MDIFTKFLPSIAIIFGGILAFWKTWGAFTEKLNGIGENFNVLKESVAINQEAISELKQFMQKSVDTHSYLQERIGKLETSSDNTDRLITNMKFEVLGKINELQQTIAGTNGKLRERIVRLEVVTELENKLGRGLNELLGSEE